MKLSKKDSCSLDEIANPNDPRLRYPAITLHTDEHLGWALLLVTLLPYLPLLESVAAFDKALKPLQSGLLVVVGLWVVIWISNVRHAGKLLRACRPGTATVVDRFIDVTGEDRRYVVVYQFEHADPDGQVRTVSGRYSCSGARFDAPIGHTINFYALPIDLSRLTHLWPEIWTITPPRALQARVLRWAGGSAAILAVASGAAWWARGLPGRQRPVVRPDHPERRGAMVGDAAVARRRAADVERGAANPGGSADHRRQPARAGRGNLAGLSGFGLLNVVGTCRFESARET